MDFEKESAKSEAIYNDLCKCAYDALHEYAPGKKLMKSLNDRLKQPIGIDCQNYAYINGQNDMIRMLNGLINHHKNGGIK